MKHTVQPGQFILYDYLQVAGGAERLILTLAEALPEFRLVVSRVYPEVAALEHCAYRPVVCLGSGVSRWLGRIPEAIWRFKTATAFLYNAEQVLYSGFYAPLAVQNQREGQKIYYCHTPPRYAYDWATVYRDQLDKPWRPVFDVGIQWFRREYAQALAGMDRVIANSATVQRRLKQQMGIDAEVIYPPVDVARFRWLSEGNYFVSLARLTPPKRVDLLIEAFSQLPDHRLVVVSGGPELKKLQQQAAGARNIQFTGWQSDAQLAEWIGRCRAALYIALDEDFGMSPVEAMAAGKPVIGAAEGGLLETMIAGETGILLPTPLTVDRIINAVLELDGSRALAMRASCERQAQRFSRAVFLDQMKTVLKAG